MDKACSKTSLIAAPTAISRTISLNCSQSCSGRDGGASALTARRHRASQGGVSRGTADQSPIGGAGPSTLPAAPTSDRYENRCVPAASRQRAGQSWCARGRGGRYSATITVRPASRPRLRSPTAAPRSGSHALLMGQRSGGRGRLGGFRRGRGTGTHLPEPVERSLGVPSCRQQTGLDQLVTADEEERQVQQGLHAANEAGLAGTGCPVQDDHEASGRRRRVDVHQIDCRAGGRPPSFCGPGTTTGKIMRRALRST